MCKYTGHIALDIQAVLDDPCVSYWTKNALQSALSRDPVDAAHDAALLAKILARRADEIVAQSVTF